MLRTVACAVFGVTLSLAVYRYLKSLNQKHFKFRAKRSREIHIVTSSTEWQEIYPQLCQSIGEIKVLGFDCEWVSRITSKRQPVALIQLATYDGLCVLVRICMMADDIPDTLRMMLFDRSILKVGIASGDDGKKLLQDYGIPVRGCVDLRYVAARVRRPLMDKGGLKDLAYSVLGLHLSKDYHIRTGNWEADYLCLKQIDYAADDALVGTDIFMQLVSWKIIGRDWRQSYYGSCVSMDTTAFWRMAESVCQGIVDVPYKHKHVPGVREDTKNSEEQEIDGNHMSPSKPQRVKNSKKAFMARQRPLYYNACLVAPDSKVLTTCDIRKAQWYLDKGLGKKIQDNPVWVQLNFEPAKRPTSDQDYYLQDKENICVVCGATQDYIRKLIVPQEYRKYFPAMLKDHSSHDVLLLCISCHLQSADYDNMLRQRLAQECNAPLDSGKDSRKMQDQDLLKVVSAAKALMTNSSKIPEARIKELEDTVKNFYGVSSLNKDLLKQTVSIDYRVKNSNFTPHGKKVVEHYMMKEGGLLEFEKLWRKQFVETMQPKYLPALWSIDHKPERLQPLTEKMRGNLKPDSFA